MNDAATLLTMASAAIVGLAIVSAALLRGWRGWLDVKRIQIEGHRSAEPAATAPPELRDLRERVRKLEAIANGVDF